MIDDIRFLSEHYSLCYLKLSIKRKFTLTSMLVPEGRWIDLDLLEHHHLQNQPVFYRICSDMEIQFSTIKVEPLVDHTIHFSYTTIIVLRKPLGNLLSVLLPESPRVDDSQFFDYDGGCYDDTKGPVYHEAFWEVLNPAEFLYWLNQDVTDPVMISYREYGLFSNFINKYPFPRLAHIVGLEIYTLFSYDFLKTYRCTEKIWNYAAIICLWKYYMGHRKIVLLEGRLQFGDEQFSINFLWDNHGEIIEYLQEVHPWFSNSPDLYELTLPYLEQAKNMRLTQT